MIETFRCADCGCPDDEHNADDLGGDCTRCGDCDGYVPGYTFDGEFADRDDV